MSHCANHSANHVPAVPELSDLPPFSILGYPLNTPDDIASLFALANQHAQSHVSQVQQLTQVTDPSLPYLVIRSSSKPHNDYMRQDSLSIPDDQIPRSQVLRLVGNATRDMLVESRNLAYLESENQMKGIRESFAGLLEKLSTGTCAPALTCSQPITPGTVVIAKREDYPLIPFWTRGEWGVFKEKEKKAGIQADARHCGRQKDRSLPNRPLAYITNAEGVGVDGYQAHAIRDRARLIWNAIAAAGCAPPTWSQAHLTAVQYYRQQMYNAHPNLQLCEGDWKVDMLAIDEYPGWYRPRKENLTDIKPDPESVSIGTVALAPPIINPTKRRHEGADRGPNNPKPPKHRKSYHEPSTNGVHDYSAPQYSDNDLMLPIATTSAQEEVDSYQSPISDSPTRQDDDSSIDTAATIGSSSAPAPTPPTLPSAPAPSSPAPAPAPAPAPPVLPSACAPSSPAPAPAPAPTPLALPSPPAPSSPALAPAPAPAPHVLPSARAPSSPAPAHPRLLRLILASHIINPFANRKPGLSSHSTPGPSPFVPPTSVATKKRTTKTGDSAFFYPNKSSNSARNLFAINYCRDHPKTTKGDFENAWKMVEGDPEKKAFYVKLSLHNKASSLKPDMKGSASSTLS
ncbi:hypothetical protein JB92DRAFT_3144157 [Gautieria morchelliformis]|nr:hypothetical protein JB92DRAFT_3144157 [Gautieria morchelliformis]